MSTDIIVAARALTKKFGSMVAVDNVSLEVVRGEFVTLLGPSGCGKTTLLRMIAGFEQPDLGEIFLDHHNVTHVPPYRRNVNQVFQSYALFPHLNVRENIAFGLRRLGLPRAEITTRVGEALTLVALEGLGERMPDQLSGGQRQRVALARALAPRPAVLLLDEPLSALDAKLRRNMQLELKRLQRQLGLTFIFVTHDQEEALTMSDRIAVMNAGRIEQIGSPAEVYNAPVTPFVAGFVGESNLYKAKRSRHEGASTHVALEGGLDLEIPAERWPAAREQGLIGLRPEKLVVSSVPIPGARNQWTVQWVDESFLGSVSYINLLTQGGLSLRAMRATTQRQGNGAPGSTWYCSIAPEDVIVVASV